MKIKGLISKTKLAKLLADNGLPSKMSFETYGRDTRAYISCGDPATRKKVEDFLEYTCGYSSSPSAESPKVGRDYYPGSSTAEIRVSYFKASHWDE